MSIESSSDLISIPFNVVSEEKQKETAARISASIGEVIHVDENVQRLAQNRLLAGRALFEAASDHAVQAARQPSGDTLE